MTIDLPQHFQFLIANWLVLLPDRLAIAIAGVCILSFLSAFIQWPKGSARPLAWHLVALIFEPLAVKLDRKGRKAPDLAFRGFLLASFIVIAALLVILGVRVLCAFWGLPFYIYECLVLVSALSTAALWRMGWRVSSKDAGHAAHYALSHTLGLDLSRSDDHARNRAALLYISNRFYDAFLLPLILYLLLGPWGVSVALAFSFMRHHVSGLYPAYVAVRPFQVLPLFFERLLCGWIRLTGSGLLVLASVITPGAGIARSLRGAQKHMDFSSLYAYALNVGLGGGFKRINGSAFNVDWQGPKDATAQVPPATLRSGVYLHASGVLWTVCLCGAGLLLLLSR